MKLPKEPYHDGYMELGGGEKKETNTSPVPLAGWK